MSLKPTMLNWIENLQSMGQYTFTRTQAEAETERSFVATQTALRRLKKQNRIVSPRRGFYIIVPLEYRATTSPPASWFIDDLMQFVDQPYYVGLLSAAAIHGAAHQQPMVFQVLTNKPVRTMYSGKVAIQFLVNGILDQMPVTKKQTETGTMRVATPETTAFDLVRYQVNAGYLNNVATVLGELAEYMDAQALVDIANHMRLPDVQRLGYLLDTISENNLVDPLAEWLKKYRPRVVPLYPGTRLKIDVNIDRRWSILPNIELEVDL